MVEEKMMKEKKCKQSNDWIFLFDLHPDCSLERG